MRNTSKQSHYLSNIENIYNITYTIPPLNAIRSFSLTQSYEHVCHQLSLIPRDDIIILISPTTSLTDISLQEQWKCVQKQWDRFVPSKFNNESFVKELLFNVICFSNLILNEIQLQNKNSFCFKINNEFDQLFTPNLLNLHRKSYSQIKDDEKLLQDYIYNNYDNITSGLSNTTNKSINETISFCYDIIENKHLITLKKNNLPFNSFNNTNDIIQPHFLRIILFKDHCCYDKYTHKELDKILTCFTKGQYIHYYGITVNIFTVPDKSEKNERNEQYEKIVNDPEQDKFELMSDTSDTFRRNDLEQVDKIVTILENKKIDIENFYNTDIMKYIKLFNVKENQPFVKLIENFDHKFKEIQNVIMYLNKQNENMRLMHNELKNNIKNEMTKELNEDLHLLKDGFNSIVQSIINDKMVEELKINVNKISDECDKYTNNISKELRQASIWQNKIKYVNTIKQCVNNFYEQIINLPQFIEFIIDTITQKYQAIINS